MIKNSYASQNINNNSCLICGQKRDILLYKHSYDNRYRDYRLHEYGSTGSKKPLCRKHLDEFLYSHSYIRKLVNAAFMFHNETKDEYNGYIDDLQDTILCKMKEQYDINNYRQTLVPIGPEIKDAE